MLRAKLQFSAILGHFLPRDPRCALLRCSFFFQISFILCFILLARILDTLDQSRLDFCPVPACGFLPFTPSAAQPSSAQLFGIFPFLQWMCTIPWILLLLWLHVPLCGPCLCQLSSVATPAGPAPGHHAHHAAPPTSSFPDFHSVAASSSLLPFSPFTYVFFFKAPVDLQLLLFGLLSAPLFSPVWA